MERSSFNSSVDREIYAVIKDEAFRLGITVKCHISNILTEYAIKRKEELNQVRCVELITKSI
jgi:hypothetical protein